MSTATMQRVEGGAVGSQPLTLKCPGCRRGMWGRDRIVKYIKKTDAAPKLVRQGQVPRWKQQVKCRDCGYEWWTVHADWANNSRAIGNCTSGAAIRDWQK